ncbi:hypothetical protein SK128_001909, partial [Halocaridina rubra]
KLEEEKSEEENECNDTCPHKKANTKTEKERDSFPQNEAELETKHVKKGSKSTEEGITQTEMTKSIQGNAAEYKLEKGKPNTHREKTTRADITHENRTDSKKDIPKVLTSSKSEMSSPSVLTDPQKKSNMDTDTSENVCSKEKRGILFKKGNVSRQNVM